MTFDKRIFVAVLVAAFNLRLAISAVAPVVDDIEADTGMSSALSGVLTSIPFLCMGVFILAAPSLVRRVGFSRLLWISLVLVAVGTVVRVGVESSALLLIGTLPLGMGGAFAGAILPGVVRRHFAARAGAATGAYAGVMSLGGALASLAIVPLATAVGGWRWGLMLMAVPAFITLAIWPWMGLRPADMPAEALAPRRRWPSRTAVLLGLMYGCESAVFAGLLGWLPPIYTADGWSVEAAGAAAAVNLLISVPTSFLVPAVSDRGDRRLWMLGSALVVCAGLVGLAIDPSAGGFVWVSLAGLGLGAMFALMLALPVDLGDTPLAVTDLTAWMLAIGYIIGAAAPVLVGAMRDLTGGFDAALWLMSGLIVLSGVLGVAAFPAPARSRAATETV